jgi:hypothetical protein
MSSRGSRSVMALTLGLVAACAMETPAQSESSPDQKADVMQVAADAAREICQAFADSQFQRSDEQRCTEDAFFSTVTPEDCDAQRAACLAEPAPRAADPLDIGGCTSELSKELMGCEATPLEVKACARAAIASSIDATQGVRCADVGSSSDTTTEDDEALPPECEVLHTRCPQLFENAVVEDGGFVCNDGQDIVDEYVCDGFGDCTSSEDESGCPGSAEDVPGYDTDPAALFGCDGGNQIPGEWVCDGYPDCQDQTDEAECSADPPSGEGDGGFVCEDGFDLPDSDYCDGTPDCSHGEDESYCGDTDDAGVPEEDDGSDDADADAGA